MSELRNPQDAASRIERLARYDPFLGPQLIVAAAIVLDVFLPDKLTPGPSWLLPSVEGLLLLVLVVITPHPRMRNSPIRRRVAIALIGFVSAVNIVSLILLCHYLLHGRGGGRALLFSGVALWGTNVLLFALWYWELDRGGPLARARGDAGRADFLFAQMTSEASAILGPGWEPGLIDYLYLSFTNSTAFSPTDTMPLSRWAKMLMLLQSAVALLTVAFVVARAVNILK
jgi:uncharacterized membrane protein